MKAKAYIIHRVMCEPELEWSKPKDCLSAEPLYTTPAQRKPLTDEEITVISKQVAEGGPRDSIDRFVRAIEAAHGIKENT